MTIQQAVRNAREQADTFLDDSGKWIEAFDANMTAQGFANIKAPCSCEDGGEFGHEPECGWGPAPKTEQKKWDLSLLGPRQANQVQDAINQFAWATKTYTELSGVIGMPETERKSYYQALIGGVWTEETKALMGGILDIFHQPTPKNYMQAITVLESARKLVKPVLVDKRITQEEHTAQLAQRAANARKEQERRELEGIYKKVWDAILAKRPARAEAVVLAELHQDTSDGQSDYYASTVVRRVAIGWRTGKREDFRQMREAAASFHETAHLGPQADDSVEHREVYSMGAGNWIGENRYSGWQVRTRDLDYGQGMIEDAIPSNSHMRKEPPTSSTGPSVSENHDKNGVEIRFPAKPEAAVIERLKANGFRWSRHGSCWYHKKDQRTLALAYQIAGRIGPAQEDLGLKAMTDVDTQFELQCERQVRR